MLLGSHCEPYELEQARRDLGEIVFSQEYRAELVDMGGQIFRREWLRYCELDGTGTSATLTFDTVRLTVSDLLRHITVDLAHIH